MLEAAEDDWRAAVDSVLLGTLRLVKALVPHLDDGAAIGLVLSTSAVFSAASSAWLPASLAQPVSTRPNAASTARLIARTMLMRAGTRRPHG